MKLLCDISSIVWTCLQAGKDIDGYQVNHNGKDVQVNSAMYGYDNAVNLIVKALNEFGLTPKDMIMVFEGRDSKKRRCMIDPAYKAHREGTRAPEAYLEFGKARDHLKQVFRDLGAIAAQQDYVEGDDVLAYIVKNMSEDCVVVTNDGDMVVLNGVNEYGSTCRVRINGETGKNKYGDFDFKLVTLYKATVGDSSDGIKGATGFGPAAFLNINGRYDDDGCLELMNLIAQGKRDEVATIGRDNSCKYLERIADQWDSVVKSYRLALLHPEWVNTVRTELEWFPGMVKAECDDERLRHWRGQSRLVTAENYDAALAFLKSKVKESPFFSIDFETTNPDESDDWLEQRGKGNVDVIGSTIVSCGITFGVNMQYGFYVSVDHADTNNCTKKQLAEMLATLDPSKYNIAHNAAGFELPVAYQELGEFFPDNGWRRFIPNMVDTRIAASFWDENQPSFGLKNLTKLLLNYEQETYEQVTTKSGAVGTLIGGRVTKSFNKEVKAATADEPAVTEQWESRQYKMDELTAKEVVHYGLDDVYTASGLWNFFELFMQLEQTLEPFHRLEQKPMYLSALAYVQGIKIDMPRLKLLEKQDKELADECWTTIEKYLIEKGWDGVTCPVYEELTPANIKQAVQITTGLELSTMVRTQSKLAILVGELDHEFAPVLAQFIADNRIDLVNAAIARHYTGKPEFNVGSPKQISKLLYEVIGMPIRLRNKATDAMRAKGIREGNPRTDDGAIDMAIKFGDVTGPEAEVLKSLLESKSCNTRNGLYWTAYPKNIHWKSGMMHPEIRQSSTNTRRWTGSNPNLQQMEGAYDGVRSVIQAELDHVFVSLDESSQEVRQLAQFAQDDNLTGCYVGESKRDTHSIVGSRVAGVSYDEFIAMRNSSDKEIAKKAAATRQIAKIVLFSTIYGATAPKVSETLGISEADAQTYIDAIFKEFPGIRLYKELSEKMASDLGYVTLEGGTRRHLAKLVNSDDSWEASKAMRQAGNARIQGSGANQLKTVMSDVWDSNLLDTTSLKWKFPCHDEVGFTVHRSDATAVIEVVHSFMTKRFLKDIPSESSIGVGLNYGQLVELEKPLAALGVGFDTDLVQKAIDSLFV